MSSHSYIFIFVFEWFQSIKANRQAKMSVKKLKANKKRKEDQSKELEQLVFDAIFDTPNIGIEVTENISNVTTTNEPETIESTMVVLKL